MKQTNATGSRIDDQEVIFVSVYSMLSSTLRSWLVVATIVNCLLLTFDFLRGDNRIIVDWFHWLCCVSDTPCFVTTAKSSSTAKYCLNDQHSNNFSRCISVTNVNLVIQFLPIA